MTLPDKCQTCGGSFYLNREDKELRCRVCERPAVPRDTAALILERNKNVKGGAPAHHLVGGGRHNRGKELND